MSEIRPVMTVFAGTNGAGKGGAYHFSLSTPPLKYPTDDPAPTPWIPQSRLPLAHFLYW